MKSMIDEKELNSVNGGVSVSLEGKDGPFYWTVKAGDTLTSISSTIGVSINDLLSNNQTKYPTMTRDHIEIGWKLVYYLDKNRK